MYTLVAVPRATANFERYPVGRRRRGASTCWRSPTSRAAIFTRAGRARPSCRSVLTIAALVVPVRHGAVPQPGDRQQRPGAQPHHLQRRLEPEDAGIMLIIAVIGMPFVLAYTAIVYWTFRGKVRARRAQLLRARRSKAPRRTRVVGHRVCVMRRGRWLAYALRALEKDALRASKR